MGSFLYKKSVKSSYLHGSRSNQQLKEVKEDDVYKKESGDYAPSQFLLRIYIQQLVSLNEKKARGLVQGIWC